MKNKIFLLVFAVGSCFNALGQLTVKNGTQIKASGELSINGGLNNSSNATDLSQTSLILSGSNQIITSASPTNIASITVNGGGTKTFNGEWTVTQLLIFTNGVINPSSGKILYTGNTTLTGSATSFINGPMFQRGSGSRFFPIGAGNVYMPMSLNSVKDAGAEIKAEAFNAGVNLTLPEDLTSVATNRYWQLSASGGVFDAASTSLYVAGSSVDASPVLVVVQADNTSGATAVNIGGGVTDDFVTSFSAINKPVLTIGVAKEVDIQVHDLITPFNADNINDQLKIVNIEYVFSNKVSLLDRWGVVVKEWKDFKNYDDPNNPNSDNYDFSKLSPGNYICVLEYKLTADAPSQKISQMITVLK